MRGPGLLSTQVGSSMNFSAMRCARTGLRPPSAHISSPGSSLKRFGRVTLSTPPTLLSRVEGDHRDRNLVAVLSAAALRSSRPSGPATRPGLVEEAGDQRGQLV